MTNSFYGGPNGKDFSVKKIFTTRYEMEKDLDKGWTSPISVGDFVVVSYGVPNDDDYDTYKNEDLTHYNKKTYNSTLWQKVYDETDGRSANGLSYKLVASMTGNTPKVTITKPTVALNADQNPQVVRNNNDLDNVIITFKLPRSQNLLLDHPCGVLDCDEDPEVVMDDNNINYPTLYFALPQSQVINRATVKWLKVNQNPAVNLNINDINHPILEFSLPVAQDLQEGTTTVLHSNQDPYIDIVRSDVNRPVLNFYLPRAQTITRHSVTWLKVNENPSVNIDRSDIDHLGLHFNLPVAQDLQQGTTEVLDVDQNPYINIDRTNVNRPILNFHLPRAQDLQEGKTEVLNANQNPHISIDRTNVNRPILNFHLPRAQVMAKPSTTVVGPGINPSVTINNSSINTPKLEFELPRAVKFYYGTLLGERTASPYSLTNEAFADYAIGDYYINAPTGFIYQVTQKTGNTCEFTYVACIQSPLPETTSVAINSFKENEDGSFVLNDPTITRSLTNEEGTAWKLEFGLPRSFLPESEYEFVDPADPGKVSVSPSAVDKIKFNFKIPRGSGMFAGTEVQGKDSHDVLDVTVEGARSGDIYLNTKTGVVYKLDKTGVWKFQDSGLKGPPGDALNVVRDYTIEVEDNFSNGLNHIIANYIDSEGVALPYSPDELFAVTFVDKVNEREVSYWYFYTEDGHWGRAQLTGGLYNLIKNVYTESTEEAPVTNKTYSIDYINKLIGGNITVENADKTTFSKDQFYALLSWGTFEDATNNTWFPELGEDYDTLSASEIISLMSWGNMASLTG